ncbi:TLC-domain containing protein [Giardia duodenalis]|uniref:TLC-domain containing protein n=1 Tax=Giardia intestinalis TaxID=5741 RepID=V6TJA5_GIAIN|nr:TLC-domain containing protein [Giardia intestinalis]
MLSLPINWLHYSCLVFTIPIWAGIRYMLSGCLRYVASRTPWASAHPVAKGKVAESGFYLIQYTLLYWFSHALIKERGIQPYHFEAFFSDYPLRLSFSANVHKFFICQLTVYSVSLLFLFSETRKNNKDFTVMLAHHVIACTLIVAGYSFRHYNFGLILANLHDVSDIFLEASKIINLTIGEPWSLVTFVLFALTFFIARIVVYPTYLIIPPITGKCDFLVEKRLGAGQNCGETRLHRWGFYGVLTSLYVIDVYWMVMIIKMIAGIFKLEVRGDVRDDQENTIRRIEKDK